MATGGLNRSIADGHEIFYEWRCNICEENDKIAEAITYCRNCSKYYCDSCLRNHNTFAKDHTVLGEADKDDWGKSTASLDSGMECSEHKGQSISMYCGHHDDVCCPVCAYLHHGDTCKPNMSYIPNVAKGIVTTTEFKNCIATNDKLLVRLMQTEKERTDCLSTLDDSRESCRKDIEDIWQSLTHRLDKLKHLSIKDMNNTFDNEKDTIQADIAKCVELRSKLSSIKQQMQTSHLNESSLFVNMKTSGTIQLNCDEICKALSNRKKKTYLVKQDSNLQQLFMTNSLVECTEVKPKAAVGLGRKPPSKHKDVLKKEFRDSTIKYLDKNQVTEIHEIARQYHVDLTMDGKRGFIEMSGMAENLFDATDKIHGVLRAADEIEHLQKEASLIANITQWFYIEVTAFETVLIKYDPTGNHKIEKAFESYQPTVELVTADGVIYVVDFSKMEEYPKNNPLDTVQVIRRNLMEEGSLDPPPTWIKMGDTENLKIEALQPTDPEYLDISQKFLTSAQANFTITKIERIQNKTLWQRYIAKRKQMNQQNRPNKKNERHLWHGIAVEAMDSINAHGFNRSYCSTHATCFGDGVYFAVNASYSTSDTYSMPDPSGFKRVYYCRVLTGEFTLGRHGMRVSPAKPSIGGVALYDSVVDSVRKPDTFIIFDDTQAYPEYIITFKK